MKHVSLSIAAGSLALSLVAGGCKKGTVTPTSEAVSSKTPLAVMIANKIGISTCDDYLVHYEKCILHAPPAQREILRARVETLWQAWKTAAQQPESRTRLPQICTIATSTAKKTLASLKCTW